MQEDKKGMADQMRHHVEACKASGMFVEEYCRLQNLKPSIYYYWRKKILGGAKLNTGSFIQLQAPPLFTGCVEIFFINGVKVHFTNLVPVDYLKQLVS